MPGLTYKQLACSSTLSLASAPCLLAAWAACSNKGRLRELASTPGDSALCSQGEPVGRSRREPAGARRSDSSLCGVSRLQAQELQELGFFQAAWCRALPPAPVPRTELLQLLAAFVFRNGSAFYPHCLHHFHCNARETRKKIIGESRLSSPLLKAGLCLTKPARPSVCPTCF